jgi:hypothetical protein
MASVDSRINAGSKVLSRRESMKKLSIFCAALVAASSMSVVPVSQAQGTGTPPCATGSTNCHFVGAGSPLQFTAAALAADELAFNHLTTGNTNGTCTFHYTGGAAGNIIDNRDPLGRIVPENGKLWVVWVAMQDGGSCASSVGDTNVSDVWAGLGVESAVGVRSFLATEPGGSSGVPGAQLQVVTGISAGNLISPASLWTDGNADVALPATVAAAIGTDSAGGTDVHVNAGLTDLRPEDVLFATTRATMALNTTNYGGLGYQGPNPNIGFPIHSSQSSAAATPIKFRLSGNDPISGLPVRSFSTSPIGAAPVVFVYNNGGSYDSNAANLSTGVNGLGTVGGPYNLAHLFDGTTVCGTGNAALGGAGAQNINLVLREPISGAMNSAEFSLFRTIGNTTDSQEVGVINPTRSPFNPLKLACAGGGGMRLRAIGNDEAISTVKNNAHTLGYTFFSFGNASSLSGAGYQYLTLDSVDPLALPGTTNQQLPNCVGMSCPSTLWTGSLSFPSLRKGTYKAWSMYRWLVDPSTSGDTLGPQALAQAAQDLVDSTVADFVPFATSTNNDGLEVYRSHFTQSAVTCTVSGTCNGNATTPNTLDGGNTLGGGPEAGGDMAGLTIGWDYGTVNTVNFGLLGKVTRTGGRPFGFSAGIPVNPSALIGKTININGASYEVVAAPSSNMLYTLTNTGTQTGVPYSAYISAVPVGVVGKKQ